MTYQHTMKNVRDRNNDTNNYEEEEIVDLENIEYQHKSCFEKTLAFLRKWYLLPLCILIATLTLFFVLTYIRAQETNRELEDCRESFHKMQMTHGLREEVGAQGEKREHGPRGEVGPPQEPKGEKCEPGPRGDEEAKGLKEEKDGPSGKLENGDEYGAKGDEGGQVDPEEDTEEPGEGFPLKDPDQEMTLFSNSTAAEAVVIFSNGGAGQHHGGMLGQFEYLEDKGYYVQSSTEQDNEMFQAVYLYRNYKDKWNVGYKPEEGGYLSNDSPSKTPTWPTGGWQYVDGIAEIYDDNLTVTPGPLSPLPRSFIVTARGAAEEQWPHCLGSYIREQRWWNGRPVYANVYGMLLYHGPEDYGWVIGEKLGYSALRGSRARHSPDSEVNWRYWSNYGSNYWSDWKPASLFVTDFDKI